LRPSNPTEISSPALSAGTTSRTCMSSTSIRAALGRWSEQAKTRVPDQAPCRMAVVGHSSTPEKAPGWDAPSAGGRWPAGGNVMGGRYGAHAARRSPCRASADPSFWRGRSFLVAQFCMHLLDSPDRYLSALWTWPCSGLLRWSERGSGCVPGARVRSHAVSSFRVERRSRSAAP
jgi:hypothetical protein